MKNEHSAASIPQSFISANSKNGFFSLYDTVFKTKTFDRIYVILGGPGTGKSTFLRQISEKAKEDGISVEEILCSSDPSSLDGVILKTSEKRIGVLDGTAPHSRIITAPAFCEEIIDLGVFWDAERIAVHKNELQLLGEKKKHSYARAYTLLSAAGALWEERRLCYAPYFDKEKARRQIRHKLGASKQTGEVTYRFMRSFSGMGEFILHALTESAQNIVYVSGNCVAAEIYLSYFEEILKNSSMKRTVFLSPLDGKSVDGIYLEESATLLLKESLKGNGGRGRRIVADRFFTACLETSKEQRMSFEGVKAMALSALSEAKKAHAAMEEFYIDSMDFEALRAYKDKKSTQILSLI
ncbi:MAG: hypothetical protein E7609_06050 [Ruminococcaceae bacterium]|nr:hypothetical protein [Oscillospiraceae bacterium]